MNNLLEWHSVFLSALVASFCLVSSNQVQSWGAGFVDYGFAFCDVISYALHLLEEDLCLSLEATTIMFEFTISVQCLFTYGYMDIWFILIHIILIKLYRFSDKAKNSQVPKRAYVLFSFLFIVQVSKNNPRLPNSTCPYIVQSHLPIANCIIVAGLI